MNLWISENIVTLIVLGVVIAVIALAAYSIYKDKKKGKSSCGNSCSGCPMSGTCHKQG